MTHEDEKREIMDKKGINKKHKREIRVDEYVDEIRKAQHKDILRKIPFSKRPIHREKHYHHNAKF